jgi:hypothetical protein
MSKLEYFMKKLIFTTILLVNILFAQFKNDLYIPSINTGYIRSTTSSFVQNFIDFSKLKMQHSFSMSYSAIGNQGFALGVFTNTLRYDFADNLNFQAAVSFVNSPYSTFGKEFSKGINGIYLQKAELNYKPSENTSISLSFSQLPYSYYNYPYGGYGYFNRWYDPVFDPWR